MNKLSAALSIVVATGLACSPPPEKDKSPNGSPNGATNASNGTHGTNNVATNNGPVTKGDQLDLLMVIDNSGSMCQEQELLRKNFDQMVGKLVDAEIDFHVGVTTTHMHPDYPLELVAESGHLQSTPQPVPGFDRSCHTGTDATGQPIADDFTPIRNAIAAAVECMETPDTSYNDVTNDEIRCALYNEPVGCAIPSRACGDTDPACEPADLFPEPSMYREIPNVLRSNDYTDAEGSVDVEALAADFGCMALVGTRGYGVEQGIAAAIEATAPDLTGGAVDSADADTSAPNHGLLRSDARFGLMFVTDENDCSHDGTLDVETACGGDVCYYQNSTAVEDSPLIEPTTLRDRLVENLSVSKGDENLTAADVNVISLHGSSNRPTEEPPPLSECQAAEYEGVQPTCATSLGVAFSGDRYERFLRSFPEGNYYPPASQEDAPLVGWMCTGDIRPALEASGEFLASGGTD